MKFSTQNAKMNLFWIKKICLPRRFSKIGKKCPDFGDNDPIVLYYGLNF